MSLWVSDESLRERFSEAPWQTALSIEGEVFRHVGGRRTVRFEHAGQGYFLKTHAQVKAPSLLKKLLPGSRMITAENEFRVAQYLQQHAIASIEPVMCYEEQTPQGNNSFLITREIDAAWTLEEVMAVHKQDDAIVSAVLKAHAQRTADLIRLGFVHKDYYLCHYFVKKTVDLARLTKDDLIIYDLHRSYVHKRGAGHWLIKDGADIGFSILHEGLSAAEQDFYFTQLASALGFDLRQRYSRQWQIAQWKIRRLQKRMARHQ